LKGEVACFMEIIVTRDCAWIKPEAFLNTKEKSKHL